MPQLTDSVSSSRLALDLGCHFWWNKSVCLWRLSPPRRWTCHHQDKSLMLLMVQDLWHKWKAIRDSDYHLFSSGSLYLMKSQILHIFVWTMACHYYLSDWALGHLEEPIHSKFNPSQRESLWWWSRCETSDTTRSVLEPYQILQEIFHSLLLPSILGSWAAAASGSYLALQAISYLNIPPNFALKYWDGVTKILISSFKQPTEFLLNGTTSTSFFPIRFRVSSRRKPPIPNAFSTSSSQYLLSDPETLEWTPSDRLK